MAPKKESTLILARCRTIITLFLDTQKRMCSESLGTPRILYIEFVIKINCCNETDS